ncbi:MAG: hypothetical protein ACOCU3_00700 [bacterium]
MIIEIANTWSDRITGDALTGEKYTSTHHPGSTEYAMGTIPGIMPVPPAPEQ